MKYVDAATGEVYHDAPLFPLPTKAPVASPHRRIKLTAAEARFINGLLHGETMIAASLAAGKHGKWGVVVLLRLCDRAKVTGKFALFAFLTAAGQVVRTADGFEVVR